ncbi:hypothetical protein [Galactobacillus timonensis]|uniref:hypothetical protein n=1 Tax=Galactobacillus timonensis TaxID=2041840 RepID=UPI001436B49F|nr:hypothetical protein [Galactobacillus timonensis]
MSETKKSNANITCNMNTDTATYRQEVMDAIEEARRLSRDSNTVGYESMEDLKKALEQE